MMTRFNKVLLITVALMPILAFFLPQNASQLPDSMSWSNHLDHLHIAKNMNWDDDRTGSHIANMQWNSHRKEVPTRSQNHTT